MLSKEEATSFLKNSWEIRNVEEKLRANRRQLLDEIVLLVQATIPFQTITLMATRPRERARPTLEDITRDCMAGVGGLCYVINVFTWSLLKGLGFSARLCKATVTNTTIHPNNHVLVLVSGVQNDSDQNDGDKKDGDRKDGGKKDGDRKDGGKKDGGKKDGGKKDGGKKDGGKKDSDLCLVECGCGFPTLRTIPLDFEEESPVYRDSFLEYKYVRHDGRILRMHGEGDKIKRNNPPVEGLDLFMGKWRRFYSFAPEPSDCLADFDADFDDVYTVPGAVVLHRSLRVVLFPGRRAVMTVNDRAIVENEDGGLETTMMESDDEIVTFYGKHFSNIKPEIVRAAIAEWRRV